MPLPSDLISPVKRIFWHAAENLERTKSGYVLQNIRFLYIMEINVLFFDAEGQRGDSGNIK